MTRRQPPATRRKAILDAAASLLVTNGLAGTSVDAVAQQAGIAKGTSTCTSHPGQTCSPLSAADMPRAWPTGPDPSSGTPIPPTRAR